VRMWLLPQYPQPRTAMRGFIRLVDQESVAET
jgi:hypothetical protein